MTKKLTFLLVAMLSLCSISTIARIKNVLKAFFLNTLGLSKLKTGSMLTKACLFFVFMVLFATANATHFRYGNISWTRDVTNPNKVTFKVSQAWRTSYFYSGTVPSVGAQISSQTVLDFGDGKTSNITLTLSSVNTADDWMYGDYTVTHTYANYTSNYTASFSNCCRISTLQNNHDLNFTVSSVLKGAATPIMYSPVSTENPIVNMPVGQTYATTTLPATDPNGYALTYSLTPNGNFGSSTVQPANSSNFFINPTTGVISFNTVGLTVGNLYNTSITVTNSVGASTMVDFLIKMVDNTPPPIFTYGTGNTPNNSFIYKIRPGASLSFPVIATNANTAGGTPTTVSLSAVGLPSGSTLATQVGTNPASRTFSWTPTSSDLGTYVLTFVATNNAGAQTYTSVTINVSVSPDFDPATPGNNSTYCAPPSVSTTPVKVKASNLDPTNLVSLSIASTLKSGMSFTPSIPTAYANPDSTLFTYTPIASDWGIQDILFRATDQQNNTTNLNYYYIVDRAPIITTTPVLTATVGQTYTYNLVATDADTAYGDFISLETASVPSFLTATDLGHGKIQITGIPTTPGTYDIDIDLEDSLSHFNGTHCGDQLQNYQLVVSDCSPNVPTVTAASRCGAGNITLTASSDAGTVVDWYNAATGGTALSTGNSFTTSVSNTTTFYAVTRNSTYGCVSSRVPVNATVKQATTSTTNASICSGGNYTFNGTSYNAAGTYTYHTTNVAGCDSTVTLVLSVKSTSTSTTHTTVGSSALPYTWNSHTYNVAGSYIVHLSNAAGCDSAATLILSIAAATSSTTNVTVGSTSLPYHWNGFDYNTAGTYTVHLTNAAGSDSAATLILSIATATSSTTNVTVGSTALPYHWNGNDYNTAGTYTVHLTNAAGSDSAATLILSIAPATSSITNVTVGSTALPYHWNGNNYNSSGSYTVHLTNAAGSDSAATLILSIAPATSSTTNQSICANSFPYSWNGNLYATVGTYTVHLTNVAGSDSAATLVLTLGSPSGIIVSQTAATCNSLNNPNYDGIVSITAATNASRFGISSLNAGSFNGAAYAHATSISSFPATVKTNVPNTGGTYILRIYGSDATCYTDVTVTVSEVLCTVNCPNTQFPNGSSLSSVDWVIPPSNSLNMANFYLPSRTNPENTYTMYAPGNLTIQTQNLSNYTAFCSDITKTLYINNNYTDYRVVPLEYLAKENAGVSGTPAQQIPDGGIGPVRAGMLRYLVDQHFVSNNSTDAGWSTNNTGIAFQIAVWEITHDQYNVANINFTVKNATSDGFYFDYASNNSTGKAILDSAEKWLNDIQNKTWDWTAYTSTVWHPVGINSPSSQDLIIAEPIALCPVPGGGVSSGGTGGTESKSLGNAISQLFINNVTNSINSKIDYAGLHAIKPIAESIQVMGNSGVSLQNLLPATHAVETALGASVNVYATSPTNLTGITNALEVQAQDYTVNTTCKAVAFATKTSSSIYGHTKPICDRLKEAELQDIQKVTINNINFMQYKLLQSNGDMEYAISFTAGKNLNSSFYDIQSKWLLEDFNGYDTMYNFQIWGINPQVVNNMVADVLNNLNYSLPYYQLTYAPVPQTYILSHRRNQSAMNVTIKNNTNATTANLQVTEYMNELSAAIPAKVIPVSINPNGITTVSFDMADHYQADIKMLDENNNTVIDEVYSNDGSWDISYNNITTSVQEFIVSNDGISASKDEYRLFRNVTLKATTSDFVSVYKLMKAAALPRDISQYNTLKFTANATGAGSLKITFVKNTITDWNSQYSVTIPAKQGTQDYSINYTDLLSNGLNGMDASDVTAITISFIVNNSNTALNASISNAKLVRSTIVFTPSVDTKMSIYPNPVVNNTFSCSFNSLRAEALTLKVIETGTGRLLYSQIVNSNLGNNTALITLPKGSFLSANNYIVTLQGDYSKYDVQKVVIKN